uniref:Uncharacterized protein n=1 Tax=Anguilla anguilla TaxID=7936 RepID=A0A0E9XG19_ANGAN
MNEAFKHFFFPKKKEKTGPSMVRKHANSKGGPHEFLCHFLSVVILNWNNHVKCSLFLLAYALLKH